MSAASASDWAARYLDLQEMLSRLLLSKRGERSRRVDTEWEEAAWHIIEPLSNRLWAETKQRLPVENSEALAKQTYCAALEAAIHLLDKLDEG